MHNRIFNPWGGSSCTISAIMLSGPGALCGWRRLITWFNSAMVNVVSFSCDLLMFASLVSTSGSGVLSFGEKTSDKCLANS
jgi:hypothetical protein